MRMNSAARAPRPNEMDEMMTSASGSWYDLWWADMLMIVGGRFE